MKSFGVVLTNNFDKGQVIGFERFTTEEEAEAFYQEKKMENIGVVKVNVEKAHEFRVLYR